MPIFFNQAVLSYNDQTALSNIVQGELVELLSATKTAASQSYRPGVTVTYAVNLVNAGPAAFTGLTLTDDLGEYAVGTGFVTPLTYVEGSALLFVNGLPQPAPAVTDEQPLTIAGIAVPAGGNATLLYSAVVNQFAPLADGSVIANTAVITGEQLTTPVAATATIPVDAAASLSIVKAIDPVAVIENVPFTYTFTILNTGEAAVATDGVTVTDVFDPILKIQSVTLGGVALAEGEDYAYNPATGLFATVPGVITVPAATVQQNPVTGVWTVTPGTAILTVTGTI